MHITGLIRDASGQVVAGAHIVALGAAHETIAQTDADAQGRFEVHGDGIVMLRATGPDWDGPAAQITTLPRLWRVEGTPRPTEVAVELTLRAAQPVAVRAFADGALLGAPSLSARRRLAAVWFRDPSDGVAAGALCWRPQDAHPWLVLPPGQRTCLQVLWTVPGFGSLVCHATHHGRGFLIGAERDGVVQAPDGTWELWLNEALASSACQRLQAVWSRLEREGYDIDADARADYAAALAHERTMLALPLPAPTDPTHLQARAQRAAEADAALSAALWALEKATLQQAEQDIQRHKNLQRTLHVDRLAGVDAAGAHVRYRQISHDFRFGVFVNPTTHPESREPFDGALWTALRAMGVNQVTLPFLWSRHEPTRGQRRDVEQDAAFPAAHLRAAGFHLKGHVSLWLWHGRYPDQWDAFLPAWLYTLAADAVRDAAYAHQRALAAAFSAHVDGFQAINEPMLSHTNALNLTLAETLELVRWSSAALRAGGCRGPIEINNCCVFAESVDADVHEQGHERTPYEFFEDVEAAAVDYDVVGIQLYYGGYMMSRLFRGGFAIRHLADLSDLIDRFSRFGKPVNISEVSVPSSAPPEDGPYVGEWHGPWSPERQAAWVRAFYTLCYSKRAVREISWWNATDEAAFIYSGGLMTDDYQPKPAYHVIRELTQAWKAEGEAIADAEGVIAFAGPAGEYEIIAEIAGTTYGPYRVRCGWEAGEVTV